MINPLFFAKMEIRFKISTFGGSLFSGGSPLSGFANNCDILSLLSEVRYFRGVVTFGTSGNNSDPTRGKYQYLQLAIRGQFLLEKR